MSASIPNSDPYEIEEDFALSSVYWDSQDEQVDQQAEGQEMYSSVATSSKVTLEYFAVSPLRSDHAQAWQDSDASIIRSPNLQSPTPAMIEAEEEEEDDRLPPPLSFSPNTSEMRLDSQSKASPLKNAEASQAPQTVVSRARSFSPLVRNMSADPREDHSGQDLLAASDQPSKQCSETSHAVEKQKQALQNVPSSPLSLPSLSQLHGRPAPSSPRRGNTHQAQIISSTSHHELASNPSRRTLHSLSFGTQQTEDIQEEEIPRPAAGDGYKRSLRQRAPKQLMPYSLEQARYVTALSRNQWEDAVVKVRTVDWSAEELAARKARQLAAGQDDLEGWLELEQGMQKRTAEDPEFVPPLEAAVPPKVKKTKKPLTEKQSRDQALRRALGGRSTADESSGEYFLFPKRSTLN